MPKEVINRATYKRVKGYNREDMNLWFHQFGTTLYNDGCRDSAAAEIVALRDEFNFGTQRIARFMKKRDAVIQAINEREFTVEEVLEEMRKEGLKIKTDFEPEVPETKGVEK